MSERLSFIQLDPRAFDYVREHLTGVNAFCTAIWETLLTTPGAVFTLAPFGTEPERLHRFDTNGLLAANRAEGDGSLKLEQAAYLIALLRDNPQSVCIVDDFEPSWAEAQLQDDRAFGVGNEVYRLLTAADPPEAFLAALRDSDIGWHGVAAICAKAPELDDDRVASASSLQEAAAAVLAFTCTAYESESFIAWSRAPQKQQPQPLEVEEPDED